MGSQTVSRLPNAFSAVLRQSRTPRTMSERAACSCPRSPCGGKHVPLGILHGSRDDRVRRIERSLENGCGELSRSAEGAVHPDSGRAPHLRALHPCHTGLAVFARAPSPSRVALGVAPPTWDARRWACMIASAGGDRRATAINFPRRCSKTWPRRCLSRNTVGLARCWCARGLGGVLIVTSRERVRVPGRRAVRLANRPLRVGQPRACAE